MITSPTYPYDSERQIKKIKQMVYGETQINGTLQEVRPANGKRQVLTITHIASDRVWIGFGGATDVELRANGFPLERGQSMIWGVGWMNLWVGPIQAICEVGDTATLRWVEGTS